MFSYVKVLSCEDANKKEKKKSFASTYGVTLKSSLQSLFLTYLQDRLLKLK